MVLQAQAVPRVLVIDDLYGRTVLDGRNQERASFCGQFLLKDVTGDERERVFGRRIGKPVAEAFFCRGQTPKYASVGDNIENDLPGILETVRSGWRDLPMGKAPWALVLLDLCFYTGRVTESGCDGALGVPKGRPEDSDPARYFGIRVLEALHRAFPDLPVVILSSKPNDGQVRQDYNTKGARGFFSKNATIEELESIIWHHGLVPDATGDIIGTSIPLLKALRSARVCARNRRNVLIRGERGTGKEHFAHYIHRQGAEGRKCALMTVNSSVLTDDLFQSELFGVVADTATGVAARTGLIEEANGGTLFLDEIKDMSSRVQAGVLRVLQDRQVLSVGSRKPFSVDVRFVSATNADIEQMVNQGTFRPDLYDRLTEGDAIQLPPLRNRTHDIPLLAERFLRQAESSSTSAKHRKMTPEALDVLLSHGWPGNVRELRTVIARSVATHPHNDLLVPMHLDLVADERRGFSAADVLEANTILPNQIAEGDDQECPRLGETHTLKQLLATVEAFRFDETAPEDLSGMLPEIERTFSRLFARYLEAGLEANLTRSPEHPEGLVNVQRTMRLLTGDDTLRTTQSKRLIKKIIEISLEDVSSLLTDSVLDEAYKMSTGRKED